ncbi:MAG TPA: type II toxin-antitoxin system PemK/MazF family toxin [archaeon]|nr:type II toxin-antitoxin system PemK/MazF family toxin [archaeon]
MMTKDGTNIKQREIYLALFPFTDLFRSKKRPVLVISNDYHNTINQDIICCYITTHKPNSCLLSPLKVTIMSFYFVY